MEIREDIPSEGYIEFITPLIENGEVEFERVEEAIIWNEMLKAAMAERKALSIVAEEDGKLVGHAGAIDKGEEKEFFIAIAGGHRRRGLGRTLLLNVLEKERNLIAYCKKDNVEGRAFYEKVGGILLKKEGNILKFSLEKEIVLKTLSKNNSQKPAYNVIVMAEEKNVLEELQEKKRKLIDRVKAATKRLKYKKIELEALEKLVKDYNEEEVQRLQRTLKRLEFKIQTNALTSKTEKDIIKKIVSIEKELAKWRPKIRAKRRKGYVEKDIEELEKEIEEIEKELKEIRAAIKEEMRKKSAKAMAERKGVKFADEVDSTVELTDIAVFEDG